MPNTILTAQTILDGKNEITAYKTASDEIYRKIKACIDTLTELNVGNFNGDSAIGYNEFFSGQITAALQTTLDSILETLNKILDTVKGTLLDETDPDLGNKNRNGGN